MGAEESQIGMEIFGNTMYHIYHFTLFIWTPTWVVRWCAFVLKFSECWPCHHWLLASACPAVIDFGKCWFCHYLLLAIFGPAIFGFCQLLALLSLAFGSCLPCHYWLLAGSFLPSLKKVQDCNLFLICPSLLFFLLPSGRWHNITKILL